MLFWAIVIFDVFLFFAAYAAGYFHSTKYMIRSRFYCFICNFPHSEFDSGPCARCKGTEFLRSGWRED